MLFGSVAAVVAVSGVVLSAGDHRPGVGLNPCDGVGGDALVFGV
ncbi:hypothetical protein [Streptomyces tsukubensis]